MEAILIPLGLFGCISICLWAVMHYNNKNKSQQQATLQKIIDSGQALSPELIATLSKPPVSGRNRDLSRGTLSIALAIAIYIFGAWGLRNETEVMWVSAFPLCIGIAYLLLFKFKPDDD